jgi:hypothetical protein
VLRSAGAILADLDEYQVRQSLALTLEFIGSPALQPIGPAETGTERAAVVSTAAVRVSMIFIGSSPLLVPPPPLAQRLRQKPVASAIMASFFEGISKGICRARRAPKAFVERKAGAFDGHRAQKTPGKFVRGFLCFA